MGNGVMIYLRQAGENLVLSKPLQIVMLGLDNAGKTSVLYQLKLNEFLSTIPTQSFNVETIKVGKNVRFSVWDAGGADSIRPLWKTYVRRADGIVFVIDSADRLRFDEVKEEFHLALHSCEKEGVPVLFIANKQDLVTAVAPVELSELLDLNSLTPKNPWFLQPASAKLGDGISDGISTLSKMIYERRKMAKKKVTSSAPFTINSAAVSEYF